MSQRVKIFNSSLGRQRVIFTTPVEAESQDVLLLSFESESQDVLLLSFEAERQDVLLLSFESESKDLLQLPVGRVRESKDLQ